MPYSRDVLVPVVHWVWFDYQAVIIGESVTLVTRVRQQVA